MKNIINILITFAFIAFFIGTTGESNDLKRETQNINTSIAGGNKLTQIINSKKDLYYFKYINVFKFEKEADQNDNSSAFVSDAFILEIKHEQVLQLLLNRNENIIFRIPVSGNNFVELELTQSFPATPDLILTSKNGINDKAEKYTPGLHYNGIIKGNENSIASISIFKDFVMGVISDESGNYVLGSIKNSDNTYSDKYIYYNDKDLNVKNNFKCGLEDNEEKFIRAIDVNSVNNYYRNGSPDVVTRLPVKVYFEADYQMYSDAGQNVEVLVNFITGMFNSVMTIYQNESIPFVISQISYWSFPDPYSIYNDSYAILLNFGANTGDNYQANLAHLISTRNAGLGGIAWIRVMCAEYSPADSAGRFAFSNIEPGYNNYPTYSWTINVVAHEMGHSLGSRHTHSCVWPAGPGGAIRAIDSCYYAEGGCFLNSQIRPTVGTIMSYCHLWSVNEGGGVNLASGFGPLPGDTIRLRYSQAGCLDRVMNSSETPALFDLKQNFPNPYNPSTTISFALPRDAKINLKVYDISGRLIADLIQNRSYTPGFYDFVFNSETYSLSSGIYFYSLESDGMLIDTKRMVLIK